jgi:Cu/Ag efflux protein CusF
MKNKLLLTALAVTVTAGAGFSTQAYANCGMDHDSAEHKKMMKHDEMKSHDHANMKHGDMIKKGEVMGKGVIHSVNTDEKKVNITHDPIPSLGWPSMTMDLAVSDDVDLKSITTEEDIMFRMVLGDDKVYRITKIMKAGDKMDHKEMKHEGMEYKDMDHSKMKHDEMKSDNHGSDAHKH